MCRWCVYHGKNFKPEKELPPTVFNFCLPKNSKDSADESNLSEIIDWEAVSYICKEIQQHIPEKLVPLKTTGDGNCLLHAISRAIWGVEAYHELLREQLAIELTENLDWYKKSIEL